MIPLAEPFGFYSSFIKWYIEQTRVQWYLEVGCAQGWTARAIADIPTVVHVDAVDIDPGQACSHPKITPWAMTSDDFFRQCEHVYNVIFIDADHSEDAVLADTLNAMVHLTESGLIVLHDTYPPTARDAEPDLCGTAWKAVERLRELDAWEVFTFPVTLGLTLIGRRELPAWTVNLG